MTQKDIAKVILVLLFLYSEKTNTSATYDSTTNIIFKNKLDGNIGCDSNANLNCKTNANAHIVTRSLISTTSSSFKNTKYRANIISKSNANPPCKRNENANIFKISLPGLASLPLKNTSQENINCKPNANPHCKPNTNVHMVKRSPASPTSLPLHCPPCEKIHCYKQRQRRLKCKGGWTLGVCGCCRVCAKLEGEQCGGQHGYLGKCDVGLGCEPQVPKLISVIRKGAESQYKVETGICRKVSSIVVIPNEICKPKCDAVYCLKNPRGICSAKDNYESFQACQGGCQHTSCRSCKFVSLDQQCRSCSRDDFKCIREFGRCVRKKSCQPKDYPCGNSIVNRKNDEVLQCQVPECLPSN